MEQLRGVEELLAADHHLPLGLEPDVAHQRDERVEDLRDTPAERGRGEVQDPEPVELVGELADLLDQRTPNQVRVVGQGLMTNPYRL